MEEIDVVKDVELAKIVSYITFDGHLRNNLGNFYLSSASSDPLNDFENLVSEKFALNAIYENGMGYGKSKKCRFYSALVSRFLYSCGAPKGDKMVTPFSVPKWIKENDVFSKAYLSIAFQCEGWIHKNNKYNSYGISFKMNKTEELFQNGFEFINELKYLLNKFGIETSNTYLKEANLRKKDGKRTKSMIFGIRTKSNHIFQKEVGFGVDSRKNELLNSATKINLIRLGLKRDLVTHNNAPL